MKKILPIIIILSLYLIGCKSKVDKLPSKSKSVTTEYIPSKSESITVDYTVDSVSDDSLDAYFEALRDTLGLDTSLHFVKEFSPFYRDGNPYGLTHANRVKALCWFAYYRDDFGMDTAMYCINYDNTFGYWGSKSSTPDVCMYKAIHRGNENRKHI